MTYLCRSARGEQGARCGGLAVCFAVDDRAPFGHICRHCLRKLPRKVRNLYWAESVEVQLEDLRALLSVDLSAVRQPSVARIYSEPVVQMDPAMWKRLVWDLEGLVTNRHYSKYHAYISPCAPGAGIGVALDDEQLRLQPGFAAAMWANWQNWQTAALVVDRGQVPVHALSDVELAAAKAWQRTVVAHLHSVNLRERALVAELKNAHTAVSVVRADPELELANYSDAP